MWRDSPTFRRKCQRVSAERGFVVKLVAHTSKGPSSVCGSTEMSRTNARLTVARVVIFSPVGTVELIAHEIEHIIEQLDGVGHDTVTRSVRPLRSSSERTSSSNAPKARVAPARPDRTWLTCVEVGAKASMESESPSNTPVRLSPSHPQTEELGRLQHSRIVHRELPHPTRREGAPRPDRTT